MLRNGVKFSYSSPAMKTARTIQDLSGRERITRAVMQRMIGPGGKPAGHSGTEPGMKCYGQHRQDDETGPQVAAQFAAYLLNTALYAYFTSNIDLSCLILII